jgi:hypothetical protein
MIVAEVAVSAWETIRFGKGVVDRLHLKFQSASRWNVSPRAVGGTWGAERRKAARANGPNAIGRACLSETGRGDRSSSLECMGKLPGFATNKDVLIGKEPGQESQADRM